MLRFHIRPTDPSFPSTEIIAHDASTVLHIVERMNCKEADVDREGAYAFSVRLDDNGLWSIYQRHPVTQAVQLQSANPAA